MSTTPSKKTDLTPVRYVGADGDFIHFTTESWVGTEEDGKIVEYDMAVCKRDGFITCTCPDAQYRGKVGHVTQPNKSFVCKHVSRLQEMFGEILRDLQD